MQVLIYTRVAPNNQKVARSDRLKAQEKRCREFASLFHAHVLRTYSDQGEMFPPYFLKGMTSLLEYLRYLNAETLVIADHPARLGSKPYIREMLMQLIEDAGGKFIPVTTGATIYLEKYGAEMIQTLKEMRF